MDRVIRMNDVGVDKLCFTAEQKRTSRFVYPPDVDEYYNLSQD
jgi:hypothetical protein